MQQPSTTTMTETHPLYPIYFDYIQPIEWAVPSAGAALYIGILAVWVFSHHRYKRLPNTHTVDLRCWGRGPPPALLMTGREAHH